MNYTYCVSVKGHFCDCLGSPVDDHEAIATGAHADAGGGPALQPLVGHVVNKVQIGRELLDTRIARVDDVNLSEVVDGHVAGLHEKAFFFGPATPERNKWRIMIRHVEKQWTIFDWTIKYENL